MTAMPTLETARLIIRPLSMDDLQTIHQILNAGFGAEVTETLDVRKRWLQWTIMGYEQLARIGQPPYGERAVVLKQTGHLIGTCGFVPCLDVFEQLPGLSHATQTTPRHFTSTEFGLFYAIEPIYQRHGYATEAAQAMIDYAFQHLHLKRIVATTTYDNAASVSVMRKLGMRIEKNPYPDPPWLQIVGILENHLTRS